MVRESAPDAFRAGHSRLYVHYCKQTPEQPDTLEQMTPLFYAVYLRGNEAYLIQKLGAFGTDLSLLANFFQ